MSARSVATAGAIRRARVCVPTLRIVKVSPLPATRTRSTMTVGSSVRSPGYRWVPARGRRSAGTACAAAVGRGCRSRPHAGPGAARHAATRGRPVRRRRSPHRAAMAAGHVFRVALRSRTQCGVFPLSRRLTLPSASPLAATEETRQGAGLVTTASGSGMEVTAARTHNGAAGSGGFRGTPGDG